jgi:CRISPR-associated protein Cas2
MFVSVVCDIGSEDNKNAVYEVLKMYGFKEIISNVYESTRIKDDTLLRLKRDLDKSTDHYDKIRFYQFPMDGTLVVTFLTNKKWKKYVVQP